MPLISLDRDWKETARYRASGGSVSKELIDFYNATLSLDTDGPEDILAGAPKLRPYAKHPTIPLALVVEPKFERVEGLNVFRCEIQYSTEIEQLVNPLSVPPVVTNDPVSRMVIRLVDANGKPKVNTAGDLFDDPPPEVEIFDVVYVVSKNVPTKLPDWYRGYANCVNSDAVTLRGQPCDPGTLRYVPRPVGEDLMGGPLGNIPYCAAQFELHYRETGWITKQPNRGFNEIIEITKANFSAAALLNQLALQGQSVPGQLPDIAIIGKSKGKYYMRRKITIGSANETPAEPQMLDKNGRLIPVPTIDNIILIDFDDYDKVPFSGVLPLK